MPYIPEDVVTKINEIADLIEVAQSHRQFKQKGSSYVGECGVCHREKMSLNPKKQIFKCFACGAGGKGAVSYLMKAEELSFPEAIKQTAEHYHIEIPKEKTERILSAFWESQLRHSGIEPDQVKYQVDLGDHVEERFRYTSGSMNHLGELSQGDDMIIHYLGLDWKPLGFRPKSRKNKIPFVRVRHRNPEHHGGAKYKSPLQSGNHLYITNKVISLYNRQIPIETLVVCEGEKKADKLSCEDVPAVGLAGIHNLSIQGEMSVLFGKIIRSCSVKNVVFLLDSDWDHIKFANGKAVDHRPKSFASAIDKFRKYFYGFANEGIYLEVFFGHHKNDKYKGMDDFLVHNRHICPDIRGEFDEAIKARDQESKFLKLVYLNSMGLHKIRDLFLLNAKSQFFEKHKENLSKLDDFLFSGVRYRVVNGEIELAQQLLPHERFFDIQEDRQGNVKYNFNYEASIHFFHARGYGRHEFEKMGRKITVHLENNIVEEVDHDHVQNYMINFCRNLEKGRDFLNFIHMGIDRYLGISRLTKFLPIDIEFYSSEKDVQYLYFLNNYWKITADSVTAHEYGTLPHTIWSNEIIQGKPKLLDPVLADKQIESATGEKVVLVAADNGGDKGHMYQFLCHTSCMHHKKLAKGQSATREDELIQLRHLLSKILAIGYIMHDYKDLSNMRAIICMDAKETEIGRSDGGTGKSLFSMMFKELMQTFVIDAKAKNLTEQNHLFEGVDERTKAIILDDCRTNIDFEFFFSKITRAVTVNPKGLKKYDVQAPQFIFNTNHVVGGSGNSFNRRQYLLAFSDYFNHSRTPKDEFGCLMFSEWDERQWNLFYNLVAHCIRIYLKYGLCVNINDRNIRRRKLRQDMGESFLEWAMDREQQKGIASLRQRAAQAGAFGGGREAASLGEYQATADIARAAQEAQLRQQGFQQARAAAAADLAARQGLGQFQTAIGAGQRQLDQAKLAADQEAAREAAFADYTQLGLVGPQLASVIGGFPAATQVQSTPPPSATQQLLGLGIGGAGLAGALGFKPFG